MNAEIRTEAAQFPEKEYINGIFVAVHIKRQATQHGSLPSLLGVGDKGIEIVYGEEKGGKNYWTDYSS
jgi:hypothetical protein